MTCIWGGDSSPRLFILLRSAAAFDGGYLMQWRISVGTINAISVHKKFCRIWNEPLIDFFPRILMPLATLLRLFYGLLAVFSYSLLIVSLLPISFLLYPYSQFSDDTPTVCDYSMVRYFAETCVSFALFCEYC